MLTLQTRQWQHWRVFFFGGASYISSHRRYDPSDYPYRQRTSTAIHGYKANAAALAYEWSATTNAETSRQEARGAWQRLCMGYAPLNGVLAYSRAPPPEGYVEAIQPRGPLKHQDV